MATGFWHQSRRVSLMTRLSAGGLLAVFFMLVGGQALALDPSLKPSQYILDPVADTGRHAAECGDNELTPARRTVTYGSAPRKASRGLTECVSLYSTAATKLRSRII